MDAPDPRRIMSDHSHLLSLLSPLLQRLADEDPSDATLAARLNADFPIDGAIVAPIRDWVLKGVRSGELTPREAGGVRFGRVAKASAETQGFSIDAVDMSGPGPGHTHPEGEFDLCFSLEGTPAFDGNPEGWTVYGPDSWHVPTVQKGRMAILYFLPNGAIRFGPKTA